MGKGKAYVEAFPALKLETVFKAHEAGLRIVEWTSERGVIIGHAEIVEIDPCAIAIRYKFFGTPNIERADGDLRVMTRTIRINPDRSIAGLICPMSGCGVISIYFVSGRWGCKRCHDLVHRIQRLSPSHKKMLAKDAVSINRACEGLSTSDDLLPGLSNLPAQLRFEVRPRWLGTGESAFAVPDADNPNYGWTTGQAGGFRLFQRVEAPALVPATRTLDRFPADIPLIGASLFRRDLYAALGARFDRLALAVAQREMVDGQLKCGTMQQSIVAACSISAIQIPSTTPTLEKRIADTGRVHVSVTLAYSGCEELWSVKAGPVSVSPRLRAELDEDRVVLATWVEAHDVPRAEAVIELALRTLHQQIAAQATVLGQYAANLADNASRFAAIVLERHARGQSITSLRSTVER